MKNLPFSLAIFLSLCLSISISAQNTATWIGGKPGRTTDWNCPANWSNNRIPDEFTEVIIPGNAFFFPVIKHSSEPIGSLLIESGASLAIENGAVFVVLGETGHFDGMMIFGQITNNGTLELAANTSSGLVCLGHIQGDGNIISPSDNAVTFVKRQ